MNQIMRIEVFRHLNTWAFDDESRGLDKEPFVAGAETILDCIIGPDYDRAILTFSRDPFPTEDKTYTIKKIRKEDGGIWYRYNGSDGLQQNGWLCPAFWKYFDEAPDVLHMRVQPVGRSD